MVDAADDVLDAEAEIGDERACGPLRSGAASPVMAMLDHAAAPSRRPPAWRRPAIECRRSCDGRRRARRRCRPGSRDCVSAPHTHRAPRPRCWRARPMAASSLPEHRSTPRRRLRPRRAAQPPPPNSRRSRAASPESTLSRQGERVAHRLPGDRYRGVTGRPSLVRDGGAESERHGRDRTRHHPHILPYHLAVPSPTSSRRHALQRRHPFGANEARHQVDLGIAVDPHVLQEALRIEGAEAHRQRLDRQVPRASPRPPALRGQTDACRRPTAPPGAISRTGAERCSILTAVSRWVAAAPSTAPPASSAQPPSPLRTQHDLPSAAAERDLSAPPPARSATRPSPRTSRAGAAPAGHRSPPCATR